MEAELLRGMIVDRDNRIARIQRKQEHLLAKEERLKDELAEAAETNSSQIITQQTEKTALLHDQQGVQHQLDNLHSHIQRQGDSLNEFILYLQQSGEIAADDTQNVMRLQAQLCKAMHSVSIVDRQKEMLKEHMEKLVKFQREELAKQSEDKAHLERSILNELMGRDTEVRGVENELKKELDAILKEMSAIREQLDDSDSDEDDESKNEESEEEDEEEEELDEEERAAKEEMMKLLQQRREEIERLEKEIEEREELIEELQIGAGEEPMDDSPKVAVTSKKRVEQDDEEDVLPEKEAPKKAETTSKTVEKKEEPVDEMAARLQQVMATASDAKVDDVDEMDLLKLAQSRLTGGGDAGGNDDEDDDDEEEEESEEEETETEFDEDYSEGMEHSEAAGDTPESTKIEEEEYDPTEKKEDPMVES